jgi:signal transduction histidine kinase/CheY-like chemotaxis protein
VDLTQLVALDRSPFSMRVIGALGDDSIAEGARLEYNQNRVTVRMSLPTFHREEDLRFRVALDGAPDAAGGEWQTASELTFPALPPGRYTVRAWARDYTGREYGPLTHSFSVAYPPWRSPTTLGLLLATLLGGMVGAHRWRLRLLRARADELAASEQRARASEAQFRALFDRAHDANLLVRERRVVEANAAAACLLERNADAIVGQSVGDLGLGAPPATVQDEPWETELRLTPDRVVPVSVTVMSIQREGGPLEHWVLRDLSAIRDAEAERRRLESQVREAQKLESLGTLAGGVAHDFNNLLGVIRGNAELARESIADPDEVADHLAAVLDASERARDLVRQILTFSRRTVPHEAVVDLGAVARSLVPMLRSLIPRSVETVLVGGDAVYPVRGDLTQLQQLLLNLCSNAEYAMRPTNGGRLELRFETTAAPAGMASPIGRAVVLRVSDTGVGMPADVRDRVFEPFFTTKPTGEGTGLGLSVLHGIVASHGGKVSVESTPGVGTTFEVVLPLQRAELAIVAAARANGRDVPQASGPNASATPASHDPLLGARVVLVDDEPAVSRVMERALTRLGCRIRAFNDPREALAYLSIAEQEVDLLLTDQTMPGLTGDDLAEAVHRERPGLPVVIVSGYSYRLTPDRLAEVGAAAVLQKPVPVGQLAETVRRVLGDRTPNRAPAR